MAVLRATLALAYISLRTTVGFAAWRSAEGLEKPRYTIVGSFGNGIEIRKYQPYIVAEVRSRESSMKKATSSGFRQVAGYIFGKNKPRRSSIYSLLSRSSGPASKMKMTAPVRTEMKTSSSVAKLQEEYSTSFVMGSKYEMGELPVPLNKNVTLRRIPGHFLAVKRFSGPPPTEEKVETYKAEILDTLSKNGLSASKGRTFVYQYHDPFATPNFLRKNEVAVAVSDKVASAVEKIRK